MDDQLHVLDGDHDHDLQEVASPVRPDDEPPVRVLSSVLDGKSMVDGMEHVLFGDAVLSLRRMELRMPLVYYES